MAKGKSIAAVGINTQKADTIEKIADLIGVRVAYQSDYWINITPVGHKSRTGLEPGLYVKVMDDEYPNPVTEAALSDFIRDDCKSCDDSSAVKDWLVALHAELERVTRHLQE